MPKARHILLVEDDDRDLELSLTAFSEAQITNPIDIARDGVEALDYLYRRNQFSDRHPDLPAVVILDLKLPKRNGIEVLTEIRSNESMQNLPVVIVTSSRQDKDIEACYHTGANAFVVKPVDFHDFLKAVGTVGSFWGKVNEPPKPIIKAEPE